MFNEHVFVPLRLFTWFAGKEPDYVLFRHTKPWNSKRKFLKCVSKSNNMSGWVLTTQEHLIWTKRQKSCIKSFSCSKTKKLQLKNNLFDNMLQEWVELFSQDSAWSSKTENQTKTNSHQKTDFSLKLEFEHIFLKIYYIIKT